MISDAKAAAAYSASGTAVYFGLTVNEIGVWVGSICAVITMAVNWYYKYQHLKLAKKGASPDGEE